MTAKASAVSAWGLQDYSQSGEQAVILELVADLPVGRWLDIGAGDGETFSNTRMLARKGWGGVAVEPAAWAFDRLVALYADGGEVSCVCACVTGEPEGLQTFHYAKDDHLSTTVPTEAAKWAEVPFKRVFAASVGLHEVLNMLGGGVSVVSIDAEGRTLELVHSYMRHRRWAEVQVLCHEREPRDRQQRARLVRAGMELVTATPNNLIWRRR